MTSQTTDESEELIPCDKWYDGFYHNEHFNAVVNDRSCVFQNMYMIISGNLHTRFNVLDYS